VHPAPTRLQYPVSNTRLSLRAAAVLRAVSTSGVWRDIIVPFSGEVAAFNANASRPVVLNCVPVRSAAGAPAGAQGGAGANPSPGSGANPRPANTAGRRLKQIGGIDPGVLPADTANAAAFPETASAAPAPTTAPGTGSGAGNVAPGVRAPPCTVQRPPSAQSYSQEPSPNNMPATL